jgi:hypothetical protein
MGRTPQCVKQFNQLELLGDYSENYEGEANDRTINLPITIRHGLSISIRVTFWSDETPREILFTSTGATFVPSP